MGTQVAETGNLGLEYADLTGNSCLCVYALLHWVWYEDEQTIYSGNMSALLRYLHCFSETRKEGTNANSDTHDDSGLWSVFTYFYGRGEHTSAHNTGYRWQAKLNNCRCEEFNTFSKPGSPGTSVSYQKDYMSSLACKDR